MTIEQMIKLLGVKTQSEDSINLCYLMDIEAFHMMATPENNFEAEMALFKDVHRYLLDQLNYKKLDTREKIRIEDKLKDVVLEEEDENFRNTYFHGLERTLLRYGRADLIVLTPGRDARHKTAYVAEMTGKLEEAISLYEHLGESERVAICRKKMGM